MPILVIVIVYKYDGPHRYYYKGGFPPSFLRDLAGAVVDKALGRIVDYRWRVSTEGNERKAQLELDYEPSNPNLISW
jgi:hypothetical protein